MDTIEKKIVQTKIEVLDEWFTFNCEKLDFKYLKKLHEFLFSEFYYTEDLGTRNLNCNEEKQIDEYLNKIIKICIFNPSDVDLILKLLYSIWNLQPFIVGNTRTVIAYLKVINACFLLNLDIDANMNIENNPRIFKKENFVNQKRLTK